MNRAVVAIPTAPSASLLTTPVWETWEALPSRTGWRRALPILSFRRKSLPSLLRRGESAPSVSLVRVMSLTNAIHSDGRGIDLSKRGDEVRKLFYAAFARGLVKDGFDPEEALQEVYKGLLARNRGKCPFDAKKSSFGHYVHIVTRCVLANYVRKEKKRAIHEVSPSGGSGAVYEGESPREWEIPVPATQEDSLRGIDYLVKRIASAFPSDQKNCYLQAVSLLAQGYSRREAASQAQVDYKQLNAVLETIRSGFSPCVEPS